MNLDNLKQEWAERDQRLEKSIQLNTRLLRESLIDRRGSSVRRGSLLGFLVELPFYILTIAVLGKFMANHADEIEFFVPALLLNTWCIAMFVVLIHQFMAMYRLDLGEPVIALQKKLVAIRMARLRTIKWGFLTGLLVWCAPFLIVFAKGVLNADLYSASAFLLYNMVGASLLALVIILLLQLYAARLQRSTRVKGLLDSLAGRDIAKASAFLKQLSSFETEEAQA